MTRGRRSSPIGALSLCLASFVTLLACTELGSSSGEELPLIVAGPPLTTPTAPEEPAAPSITDCPDGWDSELVRDEPRCVPTWSAEAPDFSTCPAGWKSDSWGTLEMVDVCVPEAPKECPAGERSDMASGQCVAVGTACPSGSDWATPPVGATSVIYVRPGASGSGTQASPFGTLDAAIAAAADGATILLAEGEYVTSSPIDGALSIVGACATGTSIVGTTAPIPEGGEDEVFEGALHVHGSGNLALSNVTLSGPRIALTVKAGGTALVKDVIVADFTPFGLWVQDESSTLSVERSSFVGGQIADGKIHAAPVVAAFDGTLSVTASAFTASRGRAIWGRERSRVTLHDVSVVDVDPGPSGVIAPIHAAPGASLEATRVRLSAFTGTGIGVDGAEAKLSWAFIEEGTASSAASANPINSQSGSDLECEHCLFRAIRGNAVYHKGAEGKGNAKLAHLVAAEVTLSADQRGSVINMADSSFTLSRVALLDLPMHSIYAEKGDGQLSDVKVTAPPAEQDTTPIGLSLHDGQFALSRVVFQGRPIMIKDAQYSLDEVSVTEWNGVHSDTGHPIGLQLIGDGELRRVHVSGGYAYGMTLAKGCTASASDVVVQDIKPTSDGYGFAAGVMSSGDLTGERWFVRGISGYGLWSDGKLSLSDAQVGQTRSGLVGAYGLGGALAGPSELTRVRIERSFGTGLAIYGSKVTLSDITISDTRPGELGARYGLGLYVTGAAVTADRMAIDGAYEGGIQIESSDVTLRDLRVSNVQPSTFFDSQGAGMWASGEGHVALERALFDDVRVVGLGFSQGASLSATDLQVHHVALGRSLLLDVFGAQVADDVGDCLLVAEGSSAEIDRALFDDCERSGILLYRGEATLGSIEVRRAPVGLVTQYADLPDYDPSKTYFEGVATPHLDDPGYPVPAGPPVGQALAEGVEFDDLIGGAP